MDSDFEKRFDEKFGDTFSNNAMYFTTKAVMYEGWLLYKDAMNQIIDEVDSETNKGE